MNSPLQFTLRACRSVKLMRKNISNSNFTRCIFMINNEGEYGSGKLTRISENAIKNKLNECSVHFTDGYTCFYLPGCGVCNKQSKKHKSDSSGLYINKKTGFFLCNKCKATGNWGVLNEFFEKSKGSPKCKDTLQDGNVEKYEKSPNTWEQAIVPKTISLLKLSGIEFQTIFNDFNLNSCSRAMAEKLQIRISEDRKILYLPLFSFGSTIVGYKTIDCEGNVQTYPSNDCPGFLMTHTNYDTVVIVAQVPDFLALASLNLSMEVLCLPHGVSNLPQIALPYLEKYQTITLWLGGPDTLDASGNFATKLNDKRCLVVKPTSNQVSALTAIKKGENISEIIKSAKSAWHESIISFNSLREEVLAELQNKDQCAGVNWKRFPTLNKILKGHRRGELTVLTGPTGSGKTTFISEYSLDLAMQGVNTLWGSFEIKNVRLAKKMLQQFAGMPMEENIDKFDYWADKFEMLPIYFMTFHGQQSLSAVMDAVEHCSYVHDIAHVIIDNVQFMISVNQDSQNMDRFWKQDVLIQSFRSFASRCNCHVTLVMHPKKGMDGLDLSINSIFGGAKAAQEADNILIIQNKSFPPSPTQKVLQISKNRFSGDLGVMPLHFDKKSFGFSKGTKSDKADGVQSKLQEEAQKYLKVDDCDWNERVIEYEDHPEELRASQNNWKNRAGWNRLMGA